MLSWEYWSLYEDVSLDFTNTIHRMMKALYTRGNKLRKRTRNDDDTADAEEIMNESSIRAQLPVSSGWAHCKMVCWDARANRHKNWHFQLRFDVIAIIICRFTSSSWGAVRSRRDWIKEDTWGRLKGADEMAQLTHSMYRILGSPGRNLFPLSLCWFW